jgi:hypothetical protein
LEADVSVFEGGVQNPEIWMHSISALTVLAFKGLALVIGYLIARLGYNLLIKGVKGEFKFKGEYNKGTVDLISASPGIFFMLMAAVILGLTMFSDSSFKTEAEKKERLNIEDTLGPRPKLPDFIGK